jgi:hypothetical protein
LGLIRSWEPKTAALEPVILTPIGSATPNSFSSSTVSAPLVSEDFNEGKISMIGYSADSDKWKIFPEGNGNNVFQVDNRNNSKYAGFSFGDDHWKNYSIEFKLKFLNSDASIGFQLRSDGSKFDVIDQNPNGEVYLAYPTSSEWVRTTTVNIPIQINTWYKIKAVINNDLIKYYVDDRLWIDGKSTSADGYLLFFASPGAFAQIDDITATEIQSDVSETKENQMKSRCGEDLITRVLSEYNVVYYNNFSKGMEELENWGADVKTSNGILTNTGRGSWKAVGRPDRMKSGKGFLIRFRYSPVTFFHIYIEQPAYSEKTHRMWGFYGDKNKLTPEAHYGTGFSSINIDWQQNDMTPNMDGWLCAFLTVSGTKFSTEIWNPENLQQISTVSEDFGKDWENFNGASAFAAENGILELDTYSELFKKN